MFSKLNQYAKAFVAAVAVAAATAIEVNGPGFVEDLSAWASGAALAALAGFATWLKANAPADDS